MKNPFKQLFDPNEKPNTITIINRFIWIVILGLIVFTVIFINHNL